MKNVLIWLVITALAIAGVLWLVDSPWIIKLTNAAEYSLDFMRGRR